jgi:hypothetical protein
MWTVSLKNRSNRKYSIFFEKYRKTFNTTAIYACHEICNGFETKSILNDCTSVTFFPQGMGHKKLHYLLDNYFGLNKEQIERIRKLETRAVTVLKTFPKLCLSERNCFIL